MGSKGARRLGGNGRGGGEAATGAFLSIAVKRHFYDLFARY